MALPHVSWTELVPHDAVVVTREASSHVDGNVSDFELEVICRLVKAHQPQTLFEIGTFDGRTTLNMAMNAAPDARVYTLDLPPDRVDETALHIDAGDRLFIEKPQSGSRFIGTDLAQRITQLFGDSGSFDFGPYEGKIDFMFVDGSHSYDYVLSDSRIALRLAKPDAVILWHDYSSYGPTPWPGLSKALDELHASEPAFRTLRHISGTAIAILQVPGPNAARWAEPPRGNADVARDSSQPEFLMADLEVTLHSQQVSAGAPIGISINARNTGLAAWLPEGCPTGPVRLGSRLLDENGTWLDVSFSRNFLPTASAIAPGQSIAFEGTVPCPQPGRYMLDFDMVADGVAWFSRNGSVTVRLPLTVV